MSERHEIVARLIETATSKRPDLGAKRLDLDRGETEIAPVCGLIIELERPRVILAQEADQFGMRAASAPREQCGQEDIQEAVHRRPDGPIEMPQGVMETRRRLPGQTGGGRRDQALRHLLH
ncbi:MAG: hypothetical protein IPK72_16615 [Candidatus Eisenbacteria bacterium]|nr:hypothetical protein [Candidatus Eisenbacteria bacterium]